MRTLVPKSKYVKNMNIKLEGHKEISLSMFPRRIN